MRFLIIQFLLHEIKGFAGFMSFFLLFKPFPQKSSRIFAVFHAFASPAKPPSQSASTIHRRLQCTKASLTEGGGSRSETEEGGRPMAAPANRILWMRTLTLPQGGYHIDAVNISLERSENITRARGYHSKNMLLTPAKGRGAFHAVPP